MTLALYKYRPESVRSLAVLIGESAAHEARLAYFGNVLWSILYVLSQGKSSYPQWQDVFKSKKRTKEETADEIKARIVREMRR